jgi:tetratricopeptide (TPR) repeat protein
MKLTFACAATAAVCLFAQHNMEHIVAKPAPKLPGMGNVNHPIATSNKEAQNFFNQGLNLIYGFNHDEAVRAFERAAQLDPKSPMPWWGKALALGPNINLDVDPKAELAAYEAIQSALKKLDAAPEAERDLVETLAKRYSNDPTADLKKLAHDYAGAMRSLSKKYPDDLDAATLFAESLMDLNPWRLWTADGQPAPGTEEIVATLESVIRRNPEHLGANHYYIHAVEASKHPESALPSAGRLAKLAPAAGHLVHMPGHIYLQLGDYSTTASTNEAAAAADRRYMAQTGAQGIYPAMYYTHNLHFIAVARAAQGRYTEAKKAADEMARNVAPMLKEMPMLEAFAIVPRLIDIQFKKWDAVLLQPEPARESALYPMWLYGRVLAFAAKGKLDDAASAQTALAKVAADTPPDIPYGTTNTVKPVMELAAAVSAAALLEAQKNSDAAITKWREAVGLYDRLFYDEPPVWYYPVRESYGHALLKAGRAPEAESVFREALAKSPRDGRLLFGLLQSLKAQHKPADAVQKEFDLAWKGAEIRLP